MALSAAQQKYYDQLVGMKGQGTPEEILKYVSGLNDYQALRSLSAYDGQQSKLTQGEDGFQNMNELESIYQTPLLSYGGDTQRASMLPPPVVPEPPVAPAQPAVATATPYTPAASSYGGGTAAPRYTADQIRAYADNILNQGGTYRDVANAAQQFGVPLNDVFSAYGMNQAQGQQFMIDQGLRDYIQPGTVDPSIINSTVQSYLQNPNLNDQQRSQALGSLATQYGVSNDQIAQATGYSLPTVQNFASQATAPQTPTATGNTGNTGIVPPPRPVAPDLSSPLLPPSYGGSTGLPTGTANPYNPMINDLSQHTTGQTGWLGSFTGPAASMLGTTPANPMGTGQGTFSQQYGGYQASPWLSATADEIGRRTQQALGQAFNSIRSNHVGNGTLGGSRQGVAEGLATSNAMDSLQGNLAGLFGQDWAASQSRGLQARGQDQGFTLGLGNLANQRYGIDTSYDLGLGNQYLTNQGQQMNFYGQQRGQDLQQLGLGAQIYDAGVRGGWAPLTTAGGLFNTTAGNNTTTTSGGQQGGGWGGLLGGALTGASMGRQFGWW